MQAFNQQRRLDEIWTVGFVPVIDNSNCVANCFCRTLPTKVSYGILEMLCYTQFIHYILFLVLQNSLALVDLGDMYVRRLYMSSAFHVLDQC